MTQDRALRPAEGRHPGVCRFIQIAEGSKAAQVVVSFELIEPDPEAGMFTSYFGSLSDAAIEHTVKALRNCGWQGDDLSELPALAEADQLNEQVELVVKHESWEGKPRAKVAWVNRPGGGKVKLERTIEGEDLRSFGQQMRSRIAAAGGKRGARPTSSRMPDYEDIPPPSDGDIPF